MCNRSLLCCEHMLHATPPLKLIRSDSTFTCLFNDSLSLTHSGYAASNGGCVYPLCSRSLLSKNNYYFFADSKEKLLACHSDKGDTNSFLLYLWISLTISAIGFCLPLRNSALSLCWFVTWSVYLLMIISRVLLFFSSFCSNYDLYGTLDVGKLCMGKMSLVKVSSENEWE